MLCTYFFMFNFTELHVKSGKYLLTKADILSSLTYHWTGAFLFSNLDPFSSLTKLYGTVLAIKIYFALIFTSKFSLFLSMIDASR